MTELLELLMYECMLDAERTVLEHVIVLAVFAVMATCVVDVVLHIEIEITLRMARKHAIMHSSSTIHVVDRD
jgi:hypothetical protein